MSEKFKTGSLIAGTYRVLDFIGEGAMGLVYKVEHTLLNKTLAFKVLKTEHLSESIWKRFRLEAQAIARLNHPNIVKIYDMSQTEDGLPFFTMDLLVGQSLDHYLQENGPLTVKEALPIFRQVCAGLAYANDHGIIHRDIKPGNIMLIDNLTDVAKCTVKIVDFGIAKLVDDGNTSEQGLTKPGEVFGSPLYMSPEQCMGAKLDQRSDMYSVGITMFQALTGRPPLLGKSAVETAALHQSKEAPMLCDLAPDIEFPRKLEEVIATMLAKAPDDRYSSLSEVAQELLRLEKGDVSNIKPQSYSQHYSEDTQQGTTQVTKKQVVLLASLALISIAAIAFLVLTYNSLTQPRKKQAQDNKTVSIFLDTNPLSKANRNDEDDILTNAQVQQIRTFVDSDKRQFSSIVKTGNQYSKVFNFPTNFSIGKVNWNFYRKPLNGTGTITIPYGRALKVEASVELRAFPELLMKFAPDDVAWFVITDVTPREPKLYPAIAHLSSLKFLELKGCKIIDADLKALEKLKKLESLNLSQTSVSCAQLIHCSLLKHLKNLQTECLIQPSVFLETLQKYNQIETLDLRHTTLAKRDVATISRMSKLTSLTVKQDELDDADIETLSKLRNLKQLNIDECPSLTIDCLSSLAKFPTLKTLIVPNQLRTEQVYGKLKRLAPQIQVTRFTD
ncbi:MAG: serine/threonine-protein kinase [Candidatus Obscuribacterales bacterium]